MLIRGQTFDKINNINTEIAGKEKELELLQGDVKRINFKIIKLIYKLKKIQKE